MQEFDHESLNGSFLSKLSLLECDLSFPLLEEEEMMEEEEQNGEASALAAIARVRALSAQFCLGSTPAACSRSTLKHEQVQILADWFLQHLGCATPSKQEKEELGRRTGLEPKQVNDWMSNTRRRFLLRAKQGLEPQSLLEYKIGKMLANPDL